MARHLARNLAGEQLIVSYMLLPNSTTHALVTKVDTVPVHIQRALISLLESPEAQRSESLADVLGRRTFADSGKNMLQVLHETKNLMSLPIDEINMTPTANALVPLREVLVAMKRLPNPAQTAQDSKGFNPHTYNQQADASGENVGVARNLIIEAEMLEHDAAMKREKAYALAPSLAPRATPLIEHAPAVDTESDASN